MGKTKALLFVVVAASVFGAASCSKNIYDEEKHYALVKYQSSVDSVDQQHDYLLTEAHPYAVTCNAGVGAKVLEIYSDNPVTSSDAELMSRVYCKEGSQVTLTVSMPKTQTTLYGALVDEEGLYTVASWGKTVHNADFSSPIATKQRPMRTSPKLQTYSYCFEDAFPEAGDYDYNDIVMRIALERTGEKVMTVHVTLAAVGTLNFQAGAIRLVGYRYQDIDSVVAVGGRTYNEDVPSPSYGLIENDDLLQKGVHNEAVLNIFVDAHWAMGENLPTVNGDYQRKYYNVSMASTSTSQQIVTRTRSYQVYFKNASALNNLTFEMIDPFIMSYYNGARLETHHFQFIGAQTFYNYNYVSFKDLPWLLIIPSGDFHYPLEGCQIGFRKTDAEGHTAMFGAYVEPNHSFGEWMENHKSNLDWFLYQYATPNQVY